ncbi:hypothetical protein [Schleiferilactobacillus shenzhenensis]|uniref:Uncharacterized protein n=1 Tax=Schleiferilactobacillus shenzhenensis LY-73 TaxID=1231336 RepID=U4TW79_9LACO|nr:hypothetical protein [Schleiferilactobacillus shenzhenensis]ERL65642.1 hypothetical protein L248_2328 [Schleiferilactobacillus shenzhenensis LY-73]
MTSRRQIILSGITVACYAALAVTYACRRQWLAGLTRQPVLMITASILAAVLPGLLSLYLWSRATTLWPQLLWGALVTVSVWLLLSLIVLLLIFGPAWPLLV